MRVGTEDTRGKYITLLPYTGPRAARTGQNHWYSIPSSVHITLHSRQIDVHLRVQRLISPSSSHPDKRETNLSRTFCRDTITTPAFDLLQFRTTVHDRLYCKIINGPVPPYIEHAQLPCVRNLFQNFGRGLAPCVDAQRRQRGPGAVQ